MGVVPIYDFLRHSGKVPDFHNENPVTCHLTFAVEIRHCFPLGDIDCDNHTRRGEQVYIYKYMMHNASTQSRKVNAYIPRAWTKIQVQESKQGSPYFGDEDEWYMA